MTFDNNWSHGYKRRPCYSRKRGPHIIRSLHHLGPKVASWPPTSAQFPASIFLPFCVFPCSLLGVSTSLTLTIPCLLFPQNGGNHTLSTIRVPGCLPPSLAPDWRELFFSITAISLTFGSYFQ